VECWCGESGERRGIVVVVVVVVVVLQVRARGEDQLRRTPDARTQAGYGYWTDGRIVREVESRGGMV
jgi:hypothetical protein